MTGNEKILIVVDMQNDFIDGALGTKEAVAIVPKVEEKIRNFDGEVFFTRILMRHIIWKHRRKNLPVKHCIRDTEGWQIRKELDALRKTEPIDKETSAQQIWWANWLHLMKTRESEALLLWDFAQTSV